MALEQERDKFLIPAFWRETGSVGERGDEEKSNKQNEYKSISRENNRPPFRKKNIF